MKLLCLQCDNQNGCMKTVFRNISEKCLQSQKGFASLLLPKFHNTVKSLDFTGNHPYNEVGTFSGISSGDSGYETLASFRKSPPLLLYAYVKFLDHAKVS